MSAVTDDRISQFDGLRALAFLAVFAHHALHVPLMWMGVDLFFVLSGFLITRILLQMRGRSTSSSSLAAFYYRRVLRILPPYFLALAAILLAFPIAADDAAWYFGFASNVRDSIFDPILGPYNSLWSIGVEEQFYLIWPWLVLFAPRRALAGVFCAVVVAAPLCRLGFADLSFHAVYRLMPCRMDLLAVGALLAVVDLSRPGWIATRRTQFVVAAAAAVAGFAALSFALPTFRTSLNVPLFNVVGFGLAVLFFASLLAIVRGSDSGPLANALRTPVLQYVGKVSYTCYLVHLLALALVEKASLDRWTTATLGLALTLALATVTWYGIERPLSRLRRAVPERPNPSVRLPLRDPGHLG